MIKGIFSTEAAMRPKMTRLEVLANNMANINTTGFKRDRVFVQMLKESSIGHQDEQGDVEGVEVARYVDMKEGPLRETDNPLDLAIQGSGFFVVDTPQGPQYTRNGNFTLTTDGSVMTTEGYAVMGSEGRIRFPSFDRMEMEKIKITQRGEILLGDEHVAQVQIVNIEHPEQLQKDQHSTFIAHPEQKVTDVPTDQIVVRQGFLEESNVNGIEEMVAMMELSRSFETDQRVIKAQDATLDRSLEIGKV